MRVISGINKVVLEVQDQDRAKQFWTASMGFDLLQDAAYGEERWLEVGSPNGNVVLVLHRGSTGPSARERGVAWRR